MINLIERAIESINNKAKSHILEAYPLEKQQSLSSDSMYAQNAIAGLLSLTSDQVMLNAVGIVTMTDDITVLKALRASVLDDSIDLSVLLIGVPEQLKFYIRAYYKMIILAIISYRLIRAVRMWANGKEVSVSELSFLELKTYKPKGCPDI